MGNAKKKTMKIIGKILKFILIALIVLLVCAYAFKLGNKAQKEQDEKTVSDVSRGKTMETTATIARKVVITTETTTVSHTTENKEAGTYVAVASKPAKSTTSAGSTGGGSTGGGSVKSGSTGGSNSGGGTSGGTTRVVQIKPSQENTSNKEQSKTSEEKQMKESSETTDIVVTTTTTNTTCESTTVEEVQTTTETASEIETNTSECEKESRETVEIMVSSETTEVTEYSWDKALIILSLIDDVHISQGQTFSLNENIDSDSRNTAEACIVSQMLRKCATEAEMSVETTYPEGMSWQTISSEMNFEGDLLITSNLEYECVIQSEIDRINHTITVSIYQEVYR